MHKFGILYFHMDFEKSSSARPRRRTCFMSFSFKFSASIWANESMSNPSDFNWPALYFGNYANPSPWRLLTIDLAAVYAAATSVAFPPVIPLMIGATFLTIPPMNFLAFAKRSQNHFSSALDYSCANVFF